MPIERGVSCGEKLGVELPDFLIAMLDLRAGDQVEITVERNRPVEVRDEAARLQAIAGLRAMRRPLPSDFKFDRDEANER